MPFKNSSRQQNIQLLGEDMKMFVNYDGYSPYIKEMSFKELYQVVDEVLREHGIFEVFSVLDDIRDTTAIVDNQQNIFEAYVTLRKKGFYRYKDLIA